MSLQCSLLDVHMQLQCYTIISCMPSSGVTRCFRHVIGEPLVQLGTSSSAYGFVNRLDLAAAVIALLLVLEIIAGVCQQPVSPLPHFLLTCCTAFA